jgi:PAS domain S-box-containing protein
MFDAIDGLPIAIAVGSLDERSKIVFVNKQFTHNFGYTLEDLPSVERWAELAYPDPAYRCEVFRDWDAAVDRAMQVRGHVESMEFRVCCKDQSVRDVVFSANVLNNLLIVSLTDVTQRRAVERELASARAQLERTAYEVTENIPVGTYTIVQPADGGMARFSFLSSRFLELTGLKREEALESPLKGFSCVHPDDFDRWVQLNVEVFEKKTRFYGETRLIVNGKVRWISAESVPRPLPDGSTVWEGVLTDITELRESRQAMLDAKMRAEQQEKLKSDFLANMSHEIRSPLTSILGLTQLLARESLDSKHRALLSNLQDAGDMLMHIVDDVLDYSRIEAGELRIDPQPFAMQALLEKLQDMHGWMAAKKGLSLRIEHAPELQGLLLGDSFRIGQIMNNLVNNAIKFTERGAITVRVQPLHRAHRNVRVRIEVDDTGQGIAPEVLPSLFTPFYQADTGSSRRFGGSGLGLSISKRLAELMGGDIEVISTPGIGSRFRLELPLTEPTHEQVHAAPNPIRQSAQSSAEPERGRLFGLTVLVVDDSPSILSLVEQMLATEGASCVLAESAVNALHKLREPAHGIHAVLMDIQMPAIDGLTATRMIRSEPELKDLPVIAMTAGILQEQQQQALAAGANTIVHKPMQIELLVRCLLKWTRPEMLEKSPLPALEKINAGHAQKMMNGNGGMFRRLLKVFLDEHAEAARHTREDLEQGREDRAAQRMHTLRGGAGQLGALELQAAAHALEQSIRTGAGTVHEHLQKLEAELKALESSVSTLLDS